LLATTVAASTTAQHSYASIPPSTQTSLQPPQTRDDDSVQQFLADLSNLQAFSGDLPVLTPTHCKRDSSYTKAWTNEDWERHQLKSFWRYQKHLMGWLASPTAGAVLPTVAVVALWSLLVTLVTRSVTPIGTFLANASFSSGITAFTAPISLLLALRTNRALNRLLEARSMFGIMMRATASLSGLTAIYIAPSNKNKALLMGRYLSIHGWTMKGLFRGEEDAIVCRAILPPHEAAWIIQTAADTPTSTIFRLRQLIASSMADLPLTASQAMEARVNELEVVLGVCKRLLASPIPPTYTWHTSRVLCVYLALLPLALASSKASIFAVVINVSVLSYVFVGIDEIGVEIEHPFPLLPMFQMASTIQRNVGNQFLMMEQGLDAPPAPLL
jgi:putative membrane protein